MYTCNIYIHVYTYYIILGQFHLSGLSFSDVVHKSRNVLVAIFFLFYQDMINTKARECHEVLRKS